MFFTVIAHVTALLTLAGLGYSALAIWSARLFLRRRSVPRGFAPDVSILKPLCGIDSGMYEAFVSNCHQQYGGSFEILFGVSTPDDPSADLVLRLQTEYPEVAIRLIHCPQNLGPNGKISVVAQLLPHARYDYLLINDSDIRVGPNYLAHVLAPFAPAAGPRPVGMVTALYRGLAYGTLGSRLEALGISTDFIPSVLTARFLERGLHFGMGSTLGVSRAALHAAFPDGLAPLAQYIADDYQLGAHIDRAGFRIELCDEVVETCVPAYRFRDFLDHQLRWLRTVRESRPAGYAGLVCANVLAWATLNLVASGASLFALALFSMALLFRVCIALGVGVGALNDRQVLRDLWLLLPRDLVALALWAWSYASDTVTWRGETFLLKNGKLIPETAAVRQAAVREEPVSGQR
ncbi:MAG TPA: bacteriohopanetetrol glucosamine biosynthesis glycosyltransferase HpnI [Acidobacteriaceae bacterium]|nr:bacteriohopanetetrol glucosamine biosynthesis glycosyltransferase HpnI [Acidobacteriaceae bacterium]